MIFHHLSIASSPIEKKIHGNLYVSNLLFRSCVKDGVVGTPYFARSESDCSTVGSGFSYLCYTVDNGI